MFAGVGLAVGYAVGALTARADDRITPVKVSPDAGWTAIQHDWKP